MQVPPSSFTKYAVNLMFEESAQHQIQDFNWQYKSSQYNIVDPMT